jgi:hypothetical protein
LGAPIPVGGTLNPGAVLVSTSAAKPYQLSSSYDSTNNVFIGTDPSVSDNNYVRELVPGESFTWTEIALPVYAWCKPLQSAALVVAYEATGSASPGRASVFTKSSAEATLLHEESFAYLAAAVGGGGAVFNPDVSLYASVIVTITCESSGAPLSAVTTNYIFASLGFADDDDLLVTPRANSYFAPQWLLCETEQTLYGLARPQSIQLPVTGKYFFGFMEFAKAATAAGGTITVQVYGSGEIVNGPRYVSQGRGMVGELPNTKMYSRSTVGVTVTENIASTNGPGTLSTVRTVGAGAYSLTLRVSDAGTVRSIAQLASPVNIQLAVTLPLLPLVLIGSTVAGTTADHSLAAQ